MTTLMLLTAVALAPAADPVQIGDVSRFDLRDREAVKAKLKTARLFQCFLDDRLLNSPYRQAKAAAEVKTRHLVTTAAYVYLYRLSDPKIDDDTKLSFLRILRVRVGEDDYRVGKVAPACPPEYEQEFAAWLDRMRAAGFDTPEAIRFNLERQREERNARRK